MPESAKVRSLFAGIAHRYDLANHLLSGGVDYYWRWRLVRAARKAQPRTILDLATGSGDVAFALRRGLGESVSVTGLDFCQPMLDEAIIKRDRHQAYASIPFVQGDILRLPFPDGSFDLATIAFGLRNLEDRGRGLAEIHRVLRPGGRLLCLEFTQPVKAFRPIYFAYLKHVLPTLATLLTKDRGAYQYLSNTIEAFPSADLLSQEFHKAGFVRVKATGLTLSIVALHEAISY
ncbi:MAG: bifunctional demethylmenaquinone methyltransferase/2-methoxy-6-polyprenyl-1,4-benzoquinol methylase UbiE [Verrucomicrobiota bacterium]|nr:bifunctional demethylmenaquinone methyltransferase/2-methoxy-6-polyprenyl-1,4-benzoquinol methylase UbiE [Verrucomicrobiota bacterium]